MLLLALFVLAIAFAVFLAREASTDALSFEGAYRFPPSAGPVQFKPLLTLNKGGSQAPPPAPKPIPLPHPAPIVIPPAPVMQAPRQVQPPPPPNETSGEVAQAQQDATAQERRRRGIGKTLLAGETGGYSANGAKTLLG